MKKITFENNEIYNIYNRGVEKRKIFLDDKDCLRFIHDLFEFNDEVPAENIYYKLSRIESYEVEPSKIREPRKLLLDILVFCLMPNHFHLIVRQLKDNGIVRFMQKLGTGYTMSFNKKHERVGHLFQGAFRAIKVSKEPHFYHLPYYIHLNPLDIEFSGWRDGKLKNYKQAIKFLNNYRWSSYLDYIGTKNFPSVSHRRFLLEVFGGTEKYKQSIKQWLKNLELERINELVLE